MLYGDPSTAELWNRLDVVLQKIHASALRGEMTIRASCVDSGGHYTQLGLQLLPTSGRQARIRDQGIRRRWQANRGQADQEQHRQDQPVPLWASIPTKELVYARLKIQTEGDGYCHFPEGRGESSSGC